jgi:hypothetical protein
LLCQYSLIPWRSWTTGDFAREWGQSNPEAHPLGGTVPSLEDVSCVFIATVCPYCHFVPLLPLPFLLLSRYRYGGFIAALSA